MAGDGPTRLTREFLGGRTFAFFGFRTFGWSRIRQGSKALSGTKLEIEAFDLTLRK